MLGWKTAVGRFVRCCAGALTARIDAAAAINMTLHVLRLTYEPDIWPRMIHTVQQ